MKISKRQLRNIIKEELSSLSESKRVLTEAADPVDYDIRRYVGSNILDTWVCVPISSAGYTLNGKNVTSTAGGQEWLWIKFYNDGRVYYGDEIERCTRIDPPRMTGLEELIEVEVTSGGGISLSGTAEVAFKDVDFGEEHGTPKVMLSGAQLSDLADKIAKYGGTASIGVDLGPGVPGAVKSVIGSSINLSFEPC